MGYKHKSWREHREARGAQRAKRAEFRKKSKVKASWMTKKFMESLLSRMKETGFNNLNLAGYSGVCPATVGRIMNGRKLDSASIIAVVGLARAAGYKLELVRLSQEEDEYYDERTIKLSEVEKLKDE